MIELQERELFAARALFAAGALLVSMACGARPGASLATTETIYQQVRGLKDQIDVTRARGAEVSAAGVLTIFSLLPLTADPQKRRRLFLAEEPVWTAVNGRNGPDSPYRTLVRLSV